MGEPGPSFLAPKPCLPLTQSLPGNGHSLFRAQAQLQALGVSPVFCSFRSMCTGGKTHNPQRGEEKNRTLPALRRHIFMSATCFQVFVPGSYTSTLFLTKGPSCPPVAYSCPLSTPTPERQSTVSRPQAGYWNQKPGSLVSSPGQPSTGWLESQCPHL